MDKHLEEIYSKLNDKDYVLAGANALHMCGLYDGGFACVEVYTEEKIIAGLQIRSTIRYHYVEDEGVDVFTEPLRDFPNIYVPIPERALVDCIRYDMEFVDEGAFCESMDLYNRSPRFSNYEYLLYVAGYYGVDKKTIDYWIDESDGAKC